MNSNSSWLEPKVLVPSGIAVAAVLALVLVLVFGGSSGDSAGSASSGSSTSSSVATPTTGPANSTEGENPSVPGPTTVEPGPYTTPTMPVKVEVPPVDGAVDGQTITVHGSPEPGSKLYGAEARLCRGDVAVVDDGMFTPTLGGVCIDRPLSPISDSKVAVAGVEPFEGLDLAFKVGVGTTTFRTQYDGPTTITCGPASPCQIVLKLQYPKGFGFKGIPVTYR